MNKATLMLVATAGLMLVGCEGHHRHAAAMPPPVNTAPMDFTSFVTQQVQSQPAFGTTDPISPGSLTTNLGLDDPTVYAKVTFGAGDALAGVTYQGSVACTQAGSTACNPAISADLNSKLN
jgi:hypothetical protein